MHPEDIKSELRKRGFTQSELAEQLKVSQQLVSNVIHDRTRSALVREAIALILKRRIEEIWAPRKRKLPGNARRTLAALEKVAESYRSEAA